MDLFIKTEMYRNLEFNSVMEFGVTAFKELDDKDFSQVKVAGLYGLSAPLNFDGRVEDDSVDCFDARDAHSRTSLRLIRSSTESLGGSPV